MTLSMNTGMGQRMEMRPSPSLIQFTEILQLTGLEMQAVIQQAVAENPALELAEVDPCPVCGAALMADGWCLRCRQRERVDASCPICGESLAAGGFCPRCRSGDALVEEAVRSLAEPESEDDAFDFLLSIADQSGLHEHLIDALRMVLDEADLPIAEYLVGELDERGFLETPLDLVARSLGVDVARVDAVLAAVQSVGPLGLGARSVAECLRIQLDRWAELGVTCALALPLITDHLAALGRGQYGQIARALGVGHDDVVAARDFIRTHLRPYPIADQADAAPWDRRSGPGFIAPDVIVRPGKDDGTFDVEVVESRRYRLSLNPVYRDIAARIDADAKPAGAGAKPAGASRKSAAAAGAMPGDVGQEPAAAAGADRSPAAAMSAAESAHVQDHVGRAQQFLAHIHDRRATMRRVAAYVMDRQKAFLRHGPRQLAPLTRAEVAEALGLHESTVSRATAGKYVLLPSRQIVPFATFFKAALSVQDVLRELVAAEDHPLTDAELVDLLRERDYHIARRTVAKYREQMGILPSSLR